MLNSKSEYVYAMQSEGVQEIIGDIAVSDSDTLLLV